MNEEKKILTLNLEDILPNRFQPRIKFNEQSILELAESIKEHGVIQPIVVRKIGSTKYEIIAGERRYKASKIAGKTTIPVIVTELNDNDSVEVALLENVQRENLTPIEEAISYRKILDMGYLKQEQLADKLGKKQSTIANKLRLLNLSEETQEALLENKISERHARSLLRIKDEKAEIAMLNKIIDERLTVRKTDEEIDKMLENNEFEVLDIKEEPVIIPEVSSNMPGTPIINDNAQPIKPITYDNPPSFGDFNTPERNNNFTNISNIPEIPSNSQLNPSESSIFNLDFNKEEEVKEEEEVIVPPTHIDVDKIATEAEDLYKEKKTPNMESLLKPSSEVSSSLNDITIDNSLAPTNETPNNDNAIIDEINGIQPGRFFNLFDDDKNDNNDGNNDNQSKTLEPFNTQFNFNNLFNEENPKPQVDNDLFTPFQVSNDYSKVEEPKIDLMAAPTSINSAPSSMGETIVEPLPSNDFNTPYKADDIITLDAPTTPVYEDYNTPINPLPELDVKIPKATNTMSAINSIRTCIEGLENRGYIVDTDEFDLENMYQIIIKIEK